jgi:hypothetical protein
MIFLVLLVHLVVKIGALMFKFSPETNLEKAFL